ncbi:MAG TPA: T9SS type A sorting domain-containing protein [candidate division WOR-3 bacterium]|uniref:T9SS type A sorting domain-containing protein n=1 Tax=candidate division WOR-3 bacterium TaxID=2052148 RepID=A0A9C9JYZ9_UNCW3|nr:T9SS type A sorting domain-containing protein [candidate division WOR-3 bacterium]
MKITSMLLQPDQDKVGFVKRTLLKTIISFIGGFFLWSVIHGSAAAATYTVTNTNDTGNGSLRWAMIQANTNPGADIINFNLPGAGVQTIYPLSQLPVLTDTAGVFIDGLSQPGASAGSNPPSSCTLMVEINGAHAGPAHGFWIFSSNNTIQGLVIDSFEQHGVRIQGTPSGAYGNVITLNFVGMDPSGTVIRRNGWNQSRYWGGIYIEVAADTVGFAFDNIIDMNLVSGNYAEGVGISSCPPGDVYNNQVFNNYIGTDYTGTQDCGNVHDGVYIGEGAHDNIIDGNLISGNDFEGVCVIGYPPLGWNSYANIITHNTIGLDINLTALPNTMDGVSIGQYGNIYQGGYASGNVIDSNTIACNGQNGVSVWEHQNTNANCDHNQITMNSIYNNGGLGIDLNDDGVTVNDNGDPDTGSNEEVNFPVINNARYFTTPSQTVIDGTIDIDTDPTQATIEVFKALADPSGYGEGQIYLGSTTADAVGNWSITVTGLNVGDDVTATTTDLNFNTSEFCQNIAVVLGIDEENSAAPPYVQTLIKSSPNPFSVKTVIRYSIPRTGRVKFSIYDISGKRVKVLKDEVCAPSDYSVCWDGADEHGEELPPGIYFCRLKTAESSITEKLIKTE